MKEKMIERNTPVRLVDQIDYEEDKVVFEKIGETKHGEMLLVAVSGGKTIDTHHVDALAIAHILEGSVDFTVEGTLHQMKEGDSIILAPGTPHSLTGTPKFKMALAKINA